MYHECIMISLFYEFERKYCVCRSYTVKFNIFKRVKRDIMGEIVASNVHPYFSDWDVSHNATVLRKTVITSMDVDK